MTRPNEDFSFSHSYFLMAITKSDLLRLSSCKNWFWLSIHEPESLAQTMAGEALANEGVAFEDFARQRFLDGVLLKSFGEPAIAKTKELLNIGKECLFQATAEHDGFLVKADVLQRNEDGTFDLYEMKASTGLKDDYLLDLAIQRVVFSDAGFDIANCFLVFLDGVYMRDGELSVDRCVQVANVTGQARALEDIEVRPLMAEAKRIVELPDIPVVNMAELTCQPNGANRCGCSDVSYKGLPDYSVFDVSRLSREDCSKLLCKGITTIDEIQPRTLKLSQMQAVQVVLTHKKMRKVNDEGLKSELEQVQYPIYFLDYETYNFALPRLNGFRPYQHYVFQYSLHVQASPDSQCEHFEFLADDISLEALEALAISLQAAVHDDGGSVVVWHRQFEEMRNVEIGQLFPQFKSFFNDLNRRIFDLEDVFKQGLFLDYRFKGRTSIKAILPVLCPQFSYAELNVQNGMEAMDGWYRWVSSEPKEPNTRKDLLDYCRLDTLAMVEIMSKLKMSPQA